MSPEPKVRLRCGKGGCSRVVAELYAPSDYDDAIAAARSSAEWTERLARVRRTQAPPVDWSGTFRVTCPKHDKPRRQFMQEVLARVAAGLDPRPQASFYDIEWKSMAPAFRLADTRKRTVEETVHG